MFMMMMMMNGDDGDDDDDDGDPYRVQARHVTYIISLLIRPDRLCQSK